MRDHFYNIVAALTELTSADEHLHANLNAESSEFIRFNQARVRQAGKLQQTSLQLALQRDNKHCSASCNLSGNQTDYDTTKQLLEALRERLAHCPDDPFLNYNDRPVSSDDSRTGTLPSSQTIAGDIGRMAADLDLVGIYAGGDIMCGYANSYGQRNWHARTIFNFDWSCHLPGNQAVKSNLAGDDWRQDELEAAITEQRQALAILKRPVKNLKPDHYRAYIAPAALAELMGLLCMDGFGLQQHKTRQSSLLKLAAGERQFSSRVNIDDNRGDNLAALFTEEGFAIADRVELIAQGALAGMLVNGRSAREFDAEVNADGETPVALEMAAGDLATANILSALDTGLYINNFWYGNYSDPNNCRMTGMTRYACFWVENGEIRAPLDVMRFDDSLYRLLGDQLEAITAERRFMHDADTYEQRSLNSMNLPGILCRELRLTL